MESQFLSCCTCTDGCRDRCPCKIQTVEGARRLNALYQSYQFGRLVDIIATGIYECGNGCLCRKNTEKPCQNSIVQRGIRQELQLFKTFKKVHKTFCSTTRHTCSLGMGNSNHVRYTLRLLHLHIHGGNQTRRWRRNQWSSYRWRVFCKSQFHRIWRGHQSRGETSRSR